jgi:molecular chaperone GrpE
MSETKQPSLPFPPTEEETGDNPFTADARVLLATEQIEGQPPCSPPHDSVGMELERVNDQALDGTENGFEYPMDGQTPLSVQSASTSIDEPGGAAEPGANSDAPAHALDERVAVLAAENERLRQRLVRWQSEFDNVRRRYDRERETARQNIQGELLRDLLPLLDNFERALGHTMTAPIGEDFMTGVVLIHKQFCALLERYGVAPIDATGEIFDPDLHEAVVIESRPGYQAHTVIAEIEKGYTLGKRLLRPARVKVATRP